MHELAITESILKTALREAAKNGAKRIVGINLCLGDYSDVMPDYVRKYFDLVSGESIAKGAYIRDRRVPARIICKTCGGETDMPKGKSRCPLCESEDIRMLSGTECIIESIEVE